MAVKCKKCGGPHPVWECSATPAKIAAYEAGLKTDRVIWPVKSIDVNLETGETKIVEHVYSKVGRPKIHPDRKAYKAQKERERRAKAKT